MKNAEIIEAIEKAIANPTPEQKKAISAYNYLSEKGIVSQCSGGKTSFEYLSLRQKNAVASAVKEEMKDPYYDQFA